MAKPLFEVFISYPIGLFPNDSKVKKFMKYRGLCDSGAGFGRRDLVLVYKSEKAQLRAIKRAQSKGAKRVGLCIRFDGDSVYTPE